MLKDRCIKQKIYYRKCNGCNQKCKNQKIKVIINYNKFGAIISKSSVPIGKNKDYCIEYSYELIN